MDHWATKYLRHVLRETDETATGLARRAKISSTTLTRPLNNPDHRFNLSSTTVEKIARATGISPAPFMNGEDDVLPSSERAASFQFVNVFPIEASAGHGAEVIEEAPLYEMAFRREWITSMTSADERELMVIRAKGDSMLPTLTDGDMMLVDTTKRNINYDGLFILRYDDVLRVKRIDRNPATGLYRVKSDNPIYDAFEVRAEDLDVIGRVIWIGRKV